MSRIRAVYDQSTKTYRGSTAELHIMPSSSQVKGFESRQMNGGPFGPFNPDQDVDGTPYREPVRKAKATAK